MILHNNDTQWNLWLIILESAIDFKSSIQVFINKNYANLYKNQLSSNKWEIVCKIIANLKPFKDVIKSIKGN